MTTKLHLGMQLAIQTGVGLHTGADFNDYLVDEKGSELCLMPSPLSPSAFLDEATAFDGQERKDLSF